MTVGRLSTKASTSRPGPKRRPGNDFALLTVASIGAGVAGFFVGWPLWALALVALLPWLPAFAADVAWTAREFGALALLYVLAVTQGGHFVEHLAQIVQIHLLGLSGTDARGLFGQLDIEWVHFVWNTWVIVAALLLLVRYPRNRWLWAATIAAAWHEAEYAYLLSVYLTTNQAGTPGLLAAGGLVGGGLPIPRPDLHFAYNLIETLPLLAAFAVEIRGRRDRPPSGAPVTLEGPGMGDRHVVTQGVGR
jgi:hypothetical protein